MSPSAPRLALFLLAVPLAPALATAWLHPRRPDWQALVSGSAPANAHELSLAEVRARAPDALWIDARPAANFAAGSVPGALSLHQDDWETGFTALVDAWDGARPLVVYCGNADCRASAEVAERLRRDLGGARVYVLRGGWEAWKAAQGGGVSR